MAEEERLVENIAIEHTRVLECYDFLRERNKHPSEAASIALAVYFIISKCILNPDSPNEQIAEDAKEIILSMKMFTPPSVMN